MATSYDKEQGWKIHLLLRQLDLETPADFTRKEDKKAFESNQFTKIRDSFLEVMKRLRLNPEDDSLKDTPSRVARMYCEEIFEGMDYDNFPSCTCVPNTMHVDEMVAVKNIEVKSMCEHHFMPFLGTASVAYIPSTKILGLSKFNRIVDFFSRRPQIQERLVEQVSATLKEILETQDVAVVISAKHLCTSFRGVEDFHSSAVTSKLSGRFLTVPELRSEFLNLARS